MTNVEMAQLLDDLCHLPVRGSEQVPAFAGELRTRPA